ncbi:MAG: 6-carboxytetrahydropterin synthase [Bacteroidetes bacterium]|nr:MAG: 6-carboxytetrahydropterin synthase [Bacteroidota bacterium]
MTPANIRITKQFRFETAHALWGYDGACRNIHGHSYILYVTLLGKPINDPNHPKYGMVMDFSVLKTIVNEQIVDQFDHALLVRRGTPHDQLANSSELFGKIMKLDYQPTCENMITDFARRISAQLPPEVKLFSLKLHETATAYAEWHATDNE